ncbi:MAG: hypothetical protein O7B99_03895 [Planctomycetota bacterium]|nr:hypothetical protein [Planctomycetota bacterium]
MRNLAVAHCCAAVVLGAAAHAQDVHVVDWLGNPGSQFLDIQPAVDAAQDGDLLLVRQGEYGSVVIDGKSLSIVAEVDATVRIGSITVRNIAVDQSVLMRDIRAVVTSTSYRVMTLEDNQGPLWFEASLFQPAVIQLPIKAGKADSTDGAVIRIEHCEAVALLRCQVSGREPLPGGIGGTQATRAIHAIDSEVALYQCEIEGGKGVSSDPFVGLTIADGKPGEAAIVLDGGFLFASGTTIRGGSGGDGVVDATGCTSGGAGGVGLMLEGTMPKAVLLDTAIAGGSGGVAGAGVCSPGGGGASSIVLSGQIDQLAGSARWMESYSPIPAGWGTLLTYHGEPGDLVFLMAGWDAQFLWDPSLSGVWLGLPLTIPFFHGQIPADGVLLKVVPPPFLLSSDKFLRFTLQPAFIATDGSAWLGAAASVVVLDQGP